MSWFTRKRLVIVLVFLCCAFFVLAKFGPISKAVSGSAMLVPLITANNQDSITTDVDGDLRADPGDTIKYTVVINNAGTDATGVNFTDTLDPNMSLVAGSVSSSVLSTGETFAVTGNVRISMPNGATDLLANDIDPITGDNSTLSITTLGGDNTAPFAGTSTQGGQVTATTGDGSFQYNPPPGFTGSDTFTYTVTSSSGGTATATVTLNITNMIWFINNSVTNGDGRLTSPFSSIANYNASSPIKDPNDIVFLYSTGSAHQGNLVLLAGQQVIGQGVDLAAVTGITVPTGSDPLPGAANNPDLDGLVGDTITLNTNNTLRGFNLRSAPGRDIFGSGFGTLTVSAMALTGTGRPLDLTNGVLNAAFTSITSNSSTLEIHFVI